MSSASKPPHGIATVRGRGYRPDQVDAYMEALSDDRDAAWERAARLTVLAKDMEAEVTRLRETVAGLPAQTYEALGQGARRLFQLVLEEAEDLRERAREEARQHVAQAEEHAACVHKAARDAAGRVRAEADEAARRVLLVAQAEAGEVRAGARRAVRKGRAEVLAAV
ncbi:DivIVA domain-containing protein, partial [Streptomyces sp. AF1A]|uniref:DivIVA domain-containing protein n=1 Tax=Streptomyces sp. AF1A TaxID=3394350 RepID=UPI0039BCAC6A